MFFLLFGFLVSFDALYVFWCVQFYYESGSGYKDVGSGLGEMVTFAQIKMLELSFDFITNSIYSSLMLSSLVETNSLSIL